MTPERKARLEAAGIDVDALSERVMGSEALMERLLGKFAASRDYPALAAALEEGGRERACAAAHTLKGFMKELCANGGSIFFSTHVLEVAEKLCDKVAILRAGKLIRSGTMEEVKGDDSLEEVFLELEGESC